MPELPSIAQASTANAQAPSLGRVLEYIVEQGPTTRRAISKSTGLTQPTITRVVQDLMDRGLVREGEKRDAAGSGRRPSELELVADGAVALGVHITASHMELGLVRLNGELIGRERVRIRPGEPGALAATARQGYAQLLESTQVDVNRILGAGVGMAGVVDRKGGVNRFAFNLEWKDVPVRQVLADSLGIPAVIESNTRAMALAERRFGIGRAGIKNFLFFLVGSGVGSAIILNGRLHRGKGIAGEIGHTSVDLGGPQCNCGGRGCLELYVADPQTLDNAAKAVGSELDGTPVEALIEHLANPILSTQLATSGALIGTSLAHAVDLLDLDAVVLAGGLFSLPPALDSLKDRVHAASIVSRVRGVQIDVSSLGDTSGIVGSAALVLDRFFRSPGAFQEPQRLHLTAHGRFAP